jgi:hypothetical protein
MVEAATNLTLLRRRCGRACTLVRDHVFGFTRTIFFEVGGDSGAGLPSSSPLAFRFGGAADLNAFTQETHEYGETEKQFGFERLDRGDSLIIGESDGTVVFYAWLMYAQVDLDQNVLVPVWPEAAYSYRVFTVERARGLGICAAYYAHIQKLLWKQGYRRLICRISPGNAPSIRAHARVGFRQRGFLWTLIAAGHEFYYADAALRTWLPAVVSAGYFSRSGFLRKHDI